MYWRGVHGRQHEHLPLPRFKVPRSLPSPHPAAAIVANLTESPPGRTSTAGGIYPPRRPVAIPSPGQRRPAAVALPCCATENPRHSPASLRGDRTFTT
jgi:hypothetical protein